MYYFLPPDRRARTNFITPHFMLSQVQFVPIASKRASPRLMAPIDGRAVSVPCCRLLHLSGSLFFHIADAANAAVQFANRLRNEFRTQSTARAGQFGRLHHSKSTVGDDTSDVTAVKGDARANG